MFGKTLNILIAEDDDIDRKQIRRALLELAPATQFTEATTIQEAIEACSNLHFDCALIDYRLPGQDGLSGITSLRERLPSLAIVMITGHGDELIATEAMKRGAADYLPKKQLTAASVSRTVKNAVEKAALLKTVAQQREQLIEANQSKERLIASLERALSDKTILLKEIHHRVKNNLAAVVSLLELQAGAFNDESFTSAIQECQRRIASMGLVHEFLYSTDHLDRVNMAKYLPRLVDELRLSHATSAARIAVTVDAENIDLLTDRSIPCGLILTELFSNAMKYAFPGTRSGSVTLRFGRLESGVFSLSCADDGVGVPPGFELRNAKSMGLRIVQVLAQQLRGEITLVNRPLGTKFELIFPPASTVEADSR